MAPSTAQLLRDLDALRHENARLKGVEAELAAALDSLRGSEERLRTDLGIFGRFLWLEGSLHCSQNDEKQNPLKMLNF